MRTDRKNYIYLFGFAFLTYLLFLSPRFYKDGLDYIETAHSIVFDGDLNTCNEHDFYTLPGYRNHTRRLLFQKPPKYPRFMVTPDYTAKGYHFTFFPYGNTLFWTPAFFIGKTLFHIFPSLNRSYSNDGYSIPYLLTLAHWNIFWWLIALRIAYIFLCRFISKDNALLSVIFVTGLGNILPFVFIDISFSHALDFLLITAFLEMRCRVYDTNRLTSSLFWGTLGGLAFIVRYQDLVLLTIPLIDLSADLFGQLRQRKALKRHLFHAFAFITGFSSIVGIQCTYWKIVHGYFFISPHTMGALAIPTFKMNSLQTIPMMFSKYHGFLSWMPLMAFAFIGLILLPKHLKRFGWSILLVFILTILYNSTRSEWWNLGFGVRRFTGFFLILMLGFGLLLQKIPNGFTRRLLVLILTLGVIYNFTFIIHHYQNGTEKWNLALLMSENLRPFSEHVYGISLPPINRIDDFFLGWIFWIKRHSWPLSTFLQNTSLSKKIFHITKYAGAFSVVLIMVWFASFSSLLKKHKKAFSNFLIVAFIISAYGILLIFSYQSESIWIYRVLQFNRIKPLQYIVLRKGTIYQGENWYNAITERDYSIPLDPPLSSGMLKMLIAADPLKQDKMQLSVRMFHHDYRLKKMLLKKGVHIFCDNAVQNRFGDAAVEQSICLTQCSMPHQSVDMIILRNMKPEIQAVLLSVWFDGSQANPNTD